MPIASGSQPPWSIFVRFAARKTPSRGRKTRPNAATAIGRQRHRHRATAMNRVVVITNVPLTAMPYALPRRADDPNPITTAATTTKSAQLTAGM